mmetsp:Transcript_23579/g.80368  ORF Transcript_23579/g.80368 Transcript_23579/m.80368 type:complete len:208 (+) Transcript_23579:68-691(+)
MQTRPPHWHVCARRLVSNRRSPRLMGLFQFFRLRRTRRVPRSPARWCAAPPVFPCRGEGRGAPLPCCHAAWAPYVGGTTTTGTLQCLVQYVVHDPRKNSLIRPLPCEAMTTAAASRSMALAHTSCPMLSLSVANDRTLTLYLMPRDWSIGSKRRATIASASSRCAAARGRQPRPSQAGRVQEAHPLRLQRWVGRQRRDVDLPGGAGR